MKRVMLTVAVAAALVWGPAGTSFCQDDEEKTGKWQQAYLSRLSREELEEFNKSKDFFHCYVLLDFAQRGAYNLTHPKDTTKSHYIYPLSLKKTQVLMDEITKG